MLVGFIGTRDGLTDKALGMLGEVLRKYYGMPAEQCPEFHTLAHVGGCTQGLELARQVGFACTAHLTTSLEFRNAFLHDREAIRPRLTEPKPMRTAVQDVVKMCNALCVAVPSYMQILSSLSWTTVEYARNRGIVVAVVYPDGKLRVD